MKKIITLLCFLTFSNFSLPAFAMYPVTEWLSFVERVLQQVTDTISNFDFDDMLGTKKEQQQAQDPTADGNPAVRENASSIPGSEFPPYADAALKTELSSEGPSIPNTEQIVKDVLTYKSETIEQAGDLAERTETGKTVKNDTAELSKNTLEKQQAQMVVVYANARALARRTLDLIEKTEEDTNTIKAEKNQKTTTGSLYKTTAASLLFRTHMILNEIATLRNSYIEIMAIDTMQAEEAPPSSSTADNVVKAATGMIGK